MNTQHGIPLIGFGTFPLSGGEANRAVRMAIEAGFRHIDTAQMYGNEAEIGKAVNGCGLPRGALFVVTKVDPGNLVAERFAPSVARSVELLGGPPDLLLIHWPPAEADFDATIDRLMAAHGEGKARRIGVSNFSPAMLRRAHERTNGAIVNNQVEFHPLIDQRAILAEAKRLGVTLSAYSPIARGRALKPAIVADVAARLGRKPSEIVLRWIVQQGVAAIPMTTKRENALSNLSVFDFDLTADDMAAISALGSRDGRVVNPGWMAGRWDD